MEESVKLSNLKLLNAEEVQAAVAGMAQLYPSTQTELDYKSNFQLLCATVLSAQATDVGVNKATPGLFSAYPTPELMMQASLEDIQEKIKTIGLYKNKSKFLKNLSRNIVEDFDGQVPQTREELMSLPGVGRKTANVVLANAFGIPAFAVDTHVERVSKRMNFVLDSASVLQVEQVMMEKLPDSCWHQAHHSILLFGRYQCIARKHDHQVCLDRLHSALPETSLAQEAFDKMSQEKK